MRLGCGVGLFTAVNRRLDEWVKVKQLDLSTVEGNEPDDGTGRKKDGKRKAEDVRTLNCPTIPIFDFAVSNAAPPMRTHLSGETPVFCCRVAAAPHSLLTQLRWWAMYVYRNSGQRAG